MDEPAQEKTNCFIPMILIIIINIYAKKYAISYNSGKPRIIPYGAFEDKTRSL